MKQPVCQHGETALTTKAGQPHSSPSLTEAPTPVLSQ